MVSTTGSSTEKPSHGQGLSIAGIVFAVLIPIVGLILSLIARNRARDIGVVDKLATAGIVISSVMLAIGLIVSAIAWANLFSTSL